MKPGQEIETTAYALFIFRQTIYIYVLDIDPVTQSWTIYSARDKAPGIHISGYVYDISPDQFETIEQITIDTQDKSMIDQTKFVLELQTKRMVKQFQKQRAIHF